MSDQRTDQRQEGDAGAGSQPRRGDPFAHGSLPQRPNYLPEEGEVGRSDLFGVVKGLLVALAAILAIAWLMTALR